MDRMRAIYQRYGWRTPFVVSALGLGRLGAVRAALFGRWLFLVTRGSKGAHTRFGRDLVISPGCRLTFGDRLYIGDRCIFEVSTNPLATVTVGDDTWISHDCHVGSYGRIDIGTNVLIGEFVSLRDTTHSYDDANIPITSQGDVIGTITIENDVWIGRGSVILGKPEGTVIGQGAVIGANSVVTRSVPAFSVVGGVPARHIRSRGTSEDE